MGESAKLPLARLGTAALPRVSLPAAGLWRKASQQPPEPVVPPELDPSLVDAWIFSGHDGESPQYIAGENGTRLYAYNFAWEPGSGFEGGALHFDGVDDYLEATGLAPLDDFTVICRREMMYANYCTASKAEVWNNGAFVLEQGSKNGASMSFGAYSPHPYIDKSDKAVALTPTAYYGNSQGTVVTIERGDAADTEYLWLGTIRSSTTTEFLAGFIKYFALYSRTLSQEEIEAETAKLEQLWTQKQQRQP